MTPTPTPADASLPHLTGGTKPRTHRLNLTDTPVKLPTPPQLKRRKIRRRDQQARLGMQRSQNYKSEVAIRGTAPLRPDGTQIKRDGKVNIDHGLLTQFDHAYHIATPPPPPPPPPDRATPIHHPADPPPPNHSIVLFR